MKTLASFLSAICIFRVSSVAAGVPRPQVIHERLPDSLSGWVMRGSVPGDTILPVRIALVQQNLELGPHYLHDVSDPVSPNFGRYWTAEKVIETFSPSRETVDAVLSWLAVNGISNSRVTHSDNRGWLAFEGSIDEMESLMHTKFNEYENLHTGQVQVACAQYHIPIDLISKIDFITPGVKLLSAKSLRTTPPQLPEELHKRSHLRSTPESLKECFISVTPACIRALYNIPLSSGPVSSTNTLGIFEESTYYAQSDLDEFFKHFTKPKIPAGTHPEAAPIGNRSPQVQNGHQSKDLEATLDLSMAYPIVYPQKIQVFQVDESGYPGTKNSTFTAHLSYALTHFLDAIDGSYCTKTSDKLHCGIYKPTNVISISNAGQEHQLPAAYQKRQCNEFLKLGMQGVSILFPSGDTGVQWPYLKNGTGCLGPQHKIFTPMWPSNCPWVTVVGGTQIKSRNSVRDPEVVWYEPAIKGSSQTYPSSSGGGFSNIHSPGQYQNDALKTYFSKHMPPYKSYSNITNDTSTIGTFGSQGGVFNRIGRGYPDVAANAFRSFLCDGLFREFHAPECGPYGGGTSAATPIFASMINRIVEKRLAAGKGPLGFLNPVLYKNPQMFNDITEGHSPGCGTPGFSAVKGWDPTTGLGTAKYSDMLDVFLKLP